MGTTCSPQPRPMNNTPATWACHLGLIHFAKKKKKKPALVFRLGICHDSVSRFPACSPNSPKIATFGRTRCLLGCWCCSRRLRPTQQLAWTVGSHRDGHDVERVGIYSISWGEALAGQTRQRPLNNRSRQSSTRPRYKHTYPWYVLTGSSLAVCFRM